MKILHDIHTHNVLSNCCRDFNATVIAYMNREKELGIKTFGLSNHVWDRAVPGWSGWYRTQHIAHSEEAKYAFDKAPEGLKVLFGCETEYFACHDILGMTVEGAKHYDYVLVPHAHMHMRNNVMWDYPEIIELREEIRARISETLPFLSEKQTEKMANALNENDLIAHVPEMKTDIIGFVADALYDGFNALMSHEGFIRISGAVPVSVAHPFQPLVLAEEHRQDVLRRLSDEKLIESFRRAAALGVSMDVNLTAIYDTHPVLEGNEMIRVLRMAKKAGCKFNFGTDAHSVEKLEWINRADEVAEHIGLCKDDMSELVRDAVAD
ncbi:MAG: hypothetical protein IJY08_05255 [Clostridia bacterium]|nr:hypothetical protein [Clostridia bacterium]